MTANEEQREKNIEEEGGTFFGSCISCGPSFMCLSQLLDRMKLDCTLIYSFSTCTWHDCFVTCERREKEKNEEVEREKLAEGIHVCLTSDLLFTLIAGKSTLRMLRVAAFSSLFPSKCPLYTTDTSNIHFSLSLSLCLCCHWLESITPFGTWWKTHSSIASLAPKMVEMDGDDDIRKWKYHHQGKMVHLSVQQNQFHLPASTGTEMVKSLVICP